MAREHLPVAAIFTSLVVGAITALSTGSISLDPNLPPTLSCFDKSSATIRVTKEVHCAAPLISLGSSPIVESATAGGIVNRIHPILQARFEAAATAADREGVHLYITSGFRNTERQAFLFTNAIKKYGSETEAAKWVLPPQFSHHPHGLAIDVNYPGDRLGAAWLETNGSRFGLCRVYANEWWHFEGVIAPGDTCPKMAPNALVDMR
ncbi:MAG: D-alanyl-D-alanine carboxypeptidase family protein [Candidatus Planktophila sp.]